MDKNIVDDNSSFFGVVYVRGEVVDFNVEEINEVVLLYLLGTSKPVNMGQVIYDSIVQLNFTKEEPFNECLESCQIKIHADDIVVNEIGEKAISRKLDVDTKERAKTKARKPLAQAKETKKQNF
ncbi:hypothetical protein M9H77_02328 [Catharanthus roseus]|uniref:Uncharacterized protein n=1 Tax=Catharanthus roseus TaxID=4058 RepID=A0ACC0C8K7_CATRO|nr:hypothetical protein M9H77_02328 [Catharanthus roseus]